MLTILVNDENLKKLPQKYIQAIFYYYIKAYAILPKANKNFFQIHLCKI